MSDIFEQVYESMLGLTCEEVALPWVPNLGHSGSEYDRAYGEMLDACRRLCDRLGVPEEDGDVECIRCAYEKMQELLCRQMFAAGAAYANMRNNKS